MSNFPVQPKCDVHNCGRPQVAKGLCEMHYRRQKRHGTVSDTVGKKTINGVLLSRHPLYNTWRNITRVGNGNLVCEAWKDFATFVRDAGDKPDNACSLRRIDTDGVFEPGNVRWMLRVKDQTSLRKNADYMKEYSARKREVNPDYYRDYDLRKKYGITLDRYNEMLLDQGGVCAICGNRETRVDKRVNRTSYLAVDHCHTTGKVRGLLCHSCNSMLGQAGDSVEKLQIGINYLRLHSPENQ